MNTSNSNKQFNKKNCLKAAQQKELMMNFSLDIFYGFIKLPERNS